MSNDAEAQAVLMFTKGLVLASVLDHADRLESLNWTVEIDGRDAIYITPSGRRLRVTVEYE